jgi:NAD(P)-dependent dehydrogenase (short-subunit alcohol dehydrogenase family)
MRLSSKVIVITGASSGIGRASAEHLAAEGAAVVLCARRTGELDVVVAGITARGGRAIGLTADVTSEADMQRLVASAVEAFGRLDVVICNAGIGYHQRFSDTPTDVMRRLMDVNVMGTLYAARAAMDVFTRQGGGHVIAVSSIVGRRGVGGSSLYSATKAAQVGFIEGLRAEFQDTSFHASVVFPVGTATEFHEAIRRDFGHDTQGHGPRQSADSVAKAIVKCVIFPTPEVYPYPLAKLLSILSVVAPRFADRFVHRYRRQAEQPKV